MSFQRISNDHHTALEMEFSTPLGCPSKNPSVPLILTFSVSPTVGWAQGWGYRLTDPTYSFLSAQVTRVMRRVTLATQVFPIRLPRARSGLDSA